MAGAGGKGGTAARVAWRGGKAAGRRRRPRRRHCERERTRHVRSTLGPAAVFRHGHWRRCARQRHRRDRGACASGGKSLLGLDERGTNSGLLGLLHAAVSAAMQRRRGPIVPLALANKARFEPPKADNALLGFLIGVLSLVSIFALCMYWGMQPTVLANAGAAEFEKDKSVAIMLASRPTIDEIEQSEVAAARQENESQGLSSVALASHKPQTDPSAKLAKAPPRTPAKPKRVARVHRPDPVHSDTMLGLSRQWRARSFGGFGSWYR